MEEASTDVDETFYSRTHFDNKASLALYPRHLHRIEDSSNRIRFSQVALGSIYVQRLHSVPDNVIGQGKSKARGCGVADVVENSSFDLLSYLVVFFGIAGYKVKLVYRPVEITEHLQNEAVGLYRCHQGLDKGPGNNR